MSKITETIKIAKDLYKHSIIKEDEYLEDKILKIITNLTILSEASTVTIKNNKDTDFINEIERVKRKVPMWLSRTHQANYKILTAFMQLSNNNENAIHVDDLASFDGIDKKTFLGHYNGMKIISEKNHAKVFDEQNKMITLWEPVKDFLVDLYKEEKC